MRDRFSQTKSTDNRQRFGKGRTLLLIILAVISIASAACAFSLMRGSAVSYAASWPTEDECLFEFELDCDVYATGHEGEEDYKYGVSLLFAEETTQSDGYVFNKYPAYYKITVPGYMFDEDYRCNAENSSFGYSGAGLAAIGSSFSISSTIYAPTPISTIRSLENFENYFKSADYYILFTKYETVYSDGQWVEVSGSSELVEISFSILTDPPSLVPLPSYTNEGFTITSDGNGGVIEKIHITGPDGETYEHRGDTYEFSLDDGRPDGQYSIYAEDELGQRSDVSYVYVDRVAPTIKQENLDGGFRITASDNLGSDNVWVADSSGDIVSDGNEYYLKKDGLEYGCYNFYAVDAAGNKSEVITVVYSAETAMGYFSYELGTASDGEKRYLLSFGWADADSYAATVKFVSADSNHASFDFKDYDGETAFYAEGEYTFVLTDIGTETDYHTYSYAIGHEWAQADDTDVSSMPCDQKIPFVCLQCGDEKTEGIGTMQHDFTGENGRVLMDATCTECAYYRYTCSKCGYSYDEEVPGTENGHSYTREYFEETCIDDAYTASVCTVCGYVDMEHVTVWSNSALGHAYILDKDNELYAEPTCLYHGYYTYYCERCGDEKVEYPAALGHDFSIFVGEWYDEENDDMHYYYQCSRCGVQDERITYKYKSGTAYRETDDEGNELLVIWDTETGIVTFSYLSASGEDLADELVVYISWGDDFAQVSAPAMIDLFEYDAAGDFTVTVYGRGDTELCALSISFSDDSLEETEEEEYEEEGEESGSLRAWVVVVIVVAVVAALVIAALVLYFVLSRRKKKPDDDDYDDEEGLFSD